MAEVERYPHGTFCWVDLGAPDPDGARAFYGSLLGWEFADVRASDGEYTLARVDGKDVAGIHSHGQDVVAAHWDSYISVDDLDAATEKARALGAEVRLEPFEIPGTARIAAFVDPAGASIALWQPTGFAGARLVNELATWTWNDLSARDPKAAERFYGELFGWTFEWVAPVYASISMGDLLVGGMRTMEDDPPDAPAAWLPYFVTDDLDRAAERVQSLGGGVIVAPREVPAGRFLVLRDPSGAVSALFEMGPDGPFRGVDRLGPEIRPPR